MSGPYNPGPGGDQPGYPGQQGYPQPGGYGQGSGYQPTNYPQPHGGYWYGQAGSSLGPGYGARQRQSVGLAGLAVAAVGAVLLVLGFTALNWYGADGDHLTFSDIHKSLGGLRAPGFPKAY